MTEFSFGEHVQILDSLSVTLIWTLGDAIPAMTSDAFAVKGDCWGQSTTKVHLIYSSILNTSCVTGSRMRPLTAFVQHGSTFDWSNTAYWQLIWKQIIAVKNLGGLWPLRMHWYSNSPNLSYNEMSHHRDPTERMVQYPYTHTLMSQHTFCTLTIKTKLVLHRYRLVSGCRHALLKLQQQASVTWEMVWIHTQRSSSCVNSRRKDTLCSTNTHKHAGPGALLGSWNTGGKLSTIFHRH